MGWGTGCVLRIWMCVEDAETVGRLIREFVEEEAVEEAG